MKRICSRMVFVTLLVMSRVRGHGQNLALHDGDRVVFYGDSITAQRLYTRFVEDFVLTRYPNLHVSFANAGVPGDTVNGGYAGDRATRLKRDLFPHQPAVVTIMLGMNDGYYMPFDPKYLEIFENGYRDLTKTIAAQVPAPRITLISPTPYDEITHGTEFAHYNEVVSRHAAFVKELAASSHFVYSDFNRVETDLLNAGAQSNPKLASLLVPDRIHPGEASHWVMAGELARNWGLTPLVSSVRIDAVQGKATEVQRAQVSRLEENDGTLQWTQIDEALPLPLPLYDEMMHFVLGLSDLAAMDQQILRVDGLSAARYTLKIDGHVIASFTRDQLAAGVNLALYSTPMQGQAKDVDGIESKRMRLDESKFILAIEDPKVSGTSDAANVIDAKDAALAEEQRNEALPKSHHFELLPQ